MSTDQPIFLYVEDDAFSREVIRTILTKVMGFSHLYFFENSDDFLGQLKKLPEQPNVILLDIQVRPHNGYELLAMLRNDPEYQSAKIVAITASVMVQDVARLQNAGFDGLIGKPLAHKVFPRLLTQIMEGEPVWYIP